MYIHDTSRIMHARSKKKSWKLGQCQTHVKYPFPPIWGPGLEEEKKKRYILECVLVYAYIHTYTCMHAHPFYPSCPLPPPPLHPHPPHNKHEWTHTLRTTHPHPRIIIVHHPTSTDIIPGCITQLPTYICAYYQSARAQQHNWLCVLVHTSPNKTHICITRGLAYICRSFI